MDAPGGTKPVGPRRAKVEEAGPLADLWLRSRHASVPAIPPPVHLADDVRAWFAEVVVATREVWLIEEEGLPVALLVLDGDWVDQLYVDPGCTGRSFGTQMLELAKQLRPDGLDLGRSRATTRQGGSTRVMALRRLGRRTATMKRVLRTSTTDGVVPLSRGGWQTDWRDIPTCR